MRCIDRSDAERITNEHLNLLHDEILSQLAPLLVALAKRAPWDAAAEREWAEAVALVVGEAERACLAEIEAAMVDIA